MTGKVPSGESSVEWVSDSIIRQIFNEKQLYEQAIAGKLKTHVKRNSHPTSPQVTGEPLCTWSQIVFYYTQEGQPIAIVHQYLRPDGTIGASGKPDPKRLFIDGRIISTRSRLKKKAK